VTTLITPPLVWPNSAASEFVCTRNSSTVSTAGTTLISLCTGTVFVPPSRKIWLL
jgi:hypothetical protein